jgi:hypothetical protein
MRLLPERHARAGTWDSSKSMYPAWDAGLRRQLVKRFNLRPEQNARQLSLGEQHQGSRCC